MNKIPSQISAVLFDWDGTLADTVPLVTRATNETLERHGFSPVTLSDIHDGMRFATVERMLYHIGRTDDNSATEKLGHELAEDFHERADRLGHEYVEVFPGVRELLTGLGELRVPMAVVTNNRGTVVRSLTRQLGLEKLFAVIIGEEDVADVKPDPEGVLRALHLLGTDTTGALFVGDSVTDAAAAVAAGVLPVGAGWPDASIVHKADNPYELVCDTPDQLLATITTAWTGGVK